MNIVTNKQSVLCRLLLTPLFFFLFLSSSYAKDINVDALLHVAKKENKNILFFHHIPSCPYCKAMLSENFKDEVILQEIKEKFIYVDIYTADQGVVSFKNFKGSNKEFSKYIGAKAYPATIFMDDEGKIVHNAIGYRNIEEFLAEMGYVSTKSHKTMDLEAYITKREMEQF